MATATSLAGAVSFLDPVMRQGARAGPEGDVSLVNALLPRCNSSFRHVSQREGTVVALQALQHLQDIESALADRSVSQDQVKDILYSSSSRRVIDALLDLVSLEGIYPYFLPGVGIPLEKRVQSTFKKYNVSAQRTATTLPHDQAIDDIISTLYAMSGRQAVFVALLERTLADLLAIMFQYAYMPISVDQKRKQELCVLLNRLPSQVLFPTLMSLLHPASPAWLRSPVAARVAVLPMQENGVRDTINFLASVASNPQPQLEAGAPSTGPLLTQELLERTSKVLCVIPASASADEWFSAISKQLWLLLDSDDADDQSIASYIIGAILSRRNIGSPGMAGWKYLASPILHAINPDLENSEVGDRQWLPRPQDVGQAVIRLSRILTLHPNVALVKRLVSRVILPLWILACPPDDYADNIISAAARLILQNHVKAAGLPAISKLADNLLRHESEAWQYLWQVDNDGNIQVVFDRKGTTSETHDLIMELVALLGARDKVFLDIISVADQEDLCSFFVDNTHKWIKDLSESESAVGLSDRAIHMSVIAPLINVRLSQGMLELNKDKLVSHPLKMLPLVQDMIKQYMKLHSSKGKSMGRLGPEDLSSIVMSTPARSSVKSQEKESESMLWVALGLITTMFADSAVNIGPDSLKALSSLKVSLEDLVQEMSLAEPLLSTARTALLQIRRLTDEPDTTQSSSKGDLHKFENSIRQRQALSKITSTLPPARVEGLSELNALIRQSSPAMASLPTVILLVSLLNEDDEYIHLSAINSITLLAQRHADSVVPQLVDMFVDVDESSSLDVRLKLGETLRRIIQDLESRMSYEVASNIAEGMTAVAGRRAKRPKEAERRAKEIKEKERDRKRAKRAWSGEVPEAPQISIETVTPADVVAAHIMEKWTGSGREEDARVRASAVTVLSEVLEKCPSRLSEEIVRSAVDVAKGILTIERDEGAAILRRAAVMLFQALFKGAEAAQYHGEQLSWTLEGTILDEILSMLETMRSNEPDDMARGHAEAIKTELEESHARAMEVKFRGQDIRFDLGDKLKGLDVQPEISGSRRAVIEELE